VFENRGLGGVFGLKRDEVTGNWIELHNEELHNLYSSPNIVKMIKSRIRWGMACSTIGGKEECI
jgi:hypothetical protein